MNTPTISHPTDRPNFSRVDVGGVTYWFSYRTVVGFHHESTGTVTRENEWGPTTRKHLNEIDGGDKKDRLTGEAFMAKLNALVLAD